MKCKEDHRNYRRNFCSCKKKPGKNLAYLKPGAFSGFLFATAKVASIHVTATVFFTFHNSIYLTASNMKINEKLLSS